MCEPVTAALAVAAPYLAAAGAAVTAIGAYNNSKAEKSSLLYQGAVADNNARTLEYQAQDQERRGELEKTNARRENDKLKGQQITVMAARGLDLSEGTPATLLQDTDYFGAVDQANIKNTTAKQAWATRIGAQNETDNSALLRSKSSSINPGMAATTSLISSAGSVAGSWYKARTPAAAPSGGGNW